MREKNNLIKRSFPSLPETESPLFFYPEMSGSSTQLDKLHGIQAKANKNLAFQFGYNNFVTTQKLKLKKLGEG
ncbi:MAG: hypothetical protein MUO88_17090 [Desulfobacterales bacterium]|nr:hypothetical protein [Desulfobacterales bacterium]